MNDAPRMNVPGPGSAIPVAGPQCHNGTVHALITCARDSVMDDHPGRTSHVDAVATLFHARHASLFRYLDRLTGDRDLAMDLAQETFVRLYRRGTLPDDPAAWLMAVATNLFRDERRVRRRRGELIAQRAADPLLTPDPESADAAVLAGESRARVRAALSSLSPRDQQLLILRHEGYSYRDLARAVGVAESSVGTLLVRATRAFRTSLPDAVDADTRLAQRRGRRASQ